MDEDFYARLLGQLTVLEEALCIVVEHAPSQTRDYLRDELQRIADRDNVSNGEYGGSVTATAERLLDGGRLRSR